MRPGLVLLALVSAGCLHRAPKVAPVAESPMHYGLVPEAHDDDLLCVESAGVSISTYVCVTIGEIRWYIRHAFHADARP